MTGLTPGLLAEVLHYYHRGMAKTLFLCFFLHSSDHAELTLAEHNTIPWLIRPGHWTEMFKLSEDSFPSHAHGANPGPQLPHPHCQPALLQKVPTRPASSADWEETTTAYRLTVLWAESYCRIILHNIRKGKLSSESLNITSKVPQLIYDRAQL